MAQVRWLQLPSLFGLRQGRVGRFGAQQLVEHIIPACGGAIDFVVLAGDIAFNAAEAEYAAADDFLTLLFEGLKIRNRRRLVVVPGNHDRNRKQADIASRLLDRWHDDEKLRREFYSDEGSELRTLATRGFEAFAAWSQRWLPYDVTTGLLPGDYSFVLPSDDAEIGIIGLNSELLASGDRSHHASIVSRQQVEAATGGAAGFVSRAQLVIAATHSNKNGLDAESLAILRSMLGDRSVLLTAPHDERSSMSVGANKPLTYSPSTSALCTIGEYDTDDLRGTFRKVEPDQRGNIRSFDQRFSFANGQAPERDSGPKIAVKSVALHGFRGVSALDIDFAPAATSPLPGRWTCLAGLNGAGKSSVLQALALALLPERDVLQLGTERLERMRRRRPKGVETALIEVALDDGTRRTFTIDESGPSGAHGVGPLVVGYGATRNLSDRLDSRSQSLSAPIRRVLTLFDPLAELARAEALVGGRSSLGPQPRLVSMIRQLAQQVLADDIDVIVERGRMSFRVHGDEVDALDLPDGFRSTLAWLADLASAWVEHAPTASDDIARIEAIVLVDEIDLHLHPSLQRELVNRLRSALPRCQFIVTTHSPLVLSSFLASEIIGLDRRAPGGVRFVDRPIIGFSMDEIYEWLMATPPTSALLEGELSKAPADRELSEAEIGEALTVSPSVDVRAARKIEARRAELLSKLKSGKL